MKNRIAFVDTLKVLAILGVITIHISADPFLHLEIGSMNWFFSVVWASIIRWSVPVFLMCSGVLFLNRNKVITLKKLYTKYILRIIIALVFWAVMYEILDIYIALHMGGHAGDAIKNALRNIVTCRTQTHLYYLYIVILIYALLPVIRVFTDAASKQQMEYALFAWVTLGIVYPFIIMFYPFSLLRGIVVQYAIVFVYATIGFFVLGYYFYQYTISKKSTYIIYALGIIGLIITIGGTIYMSMSSKTVKSYLLEGMSPNVAAMAAGLFLFVKNHYSKSNEREGLKSKIIGYLSKGSFCIYLVHVFFNIAFKNLDLLNPKFSTIYSIPVLVLINLVLSLGVYYVLSKIPFANKYLV